MVGDRCAAYRTCLRTARYSGQPGAFLKEWASFVETNLEGAQIEHGRIGFDLTKVGMQRGVDRHM